MASPSPSLCTRAPVLANNIQCLSTEPFVVQKEGPAHSYRQERIVGWRGEVPREAWRLREARVGRGSRPSSPGISRGSHLCLLLRLGHKEWVYGQPTSLCAAAISSLGNRPTAPRASESPQSGGGPLFLGTVSSHSGCPGAPGRGSKHTLTRFRGKESGKANPQR